MKYLSGLILLRLGILAAAVPSVADTSPPAVSLQGDSWPLEKAAVEPTKHVKWGRLENGLRYAIMPHTSPRGRVSLRLLVSAGSLNENNNQRGYAHFVEHMAFEGTKHFKAGEVVKVLQRQGAAFGPHVNASTTNTSTLYKLELPGNSAAMLETGLSIFRDYADGILFDPAEVQRERGVILSEEQFRRTDDEAEQSARTALLYSGTLVPIRQPIGLTAQIEHAKPSGLRKFYKTWYRPETMSVVVVGDIDPAEAETLVRAQFSSLAARGRIPPLPALGTVAPTTEPVVGTHIKELSGVNISLIKVSRGTAMPPTWGTRLEGLRLHSALSMLERRLERLTQAADQTINRSSTSIEVEYGEFRVLSVDVSSGSAEWENAMAVAEQEVRRVLEHGFDPGELNYQQSFLRNLFRDSARTTATQPSANIAERIANSLDAYSRFTFADETLDIDLAMVDRLTATDCQRSFREYWGKQAPRIFVTADAEHIPSAEKVRAVYAASQRIPVEATKDVTSLTFAYDNFGPAGSIAEKTYVPDLDLWLVRCANGVRLNLKRTAFENGSVRLNVRIGAGSLREPVDKPGLRFWAGDWWAGGVGQHTAGELRRIGDGLDGITTGADEGALVLTSSARTECVARALRELTAIVADPAFRPEGHRDTTAKLHSRLDPLWRSPEGPVQRFILPSLAGEDLSAGFPAPETIFARTLEEFRTWIMPQLTSGTIEIAAVGDFEVDTLITEFAKTFGTLPVRQPQAVALPKEPGIQLPPQTVETHYYYNGPADRRTTLDLFWPIREALTAAERRRLAMLALILEDRVRDEVRRKKGATYSPHAGFFLNKSHPGLAGIRCTLQVKPQEALFYCNTVRDLAVVLEAQGITPDELVRAKAQNAAALQDLKTNNFYWLTAILSEAQERPEILADLRTAETDIAQTSAADLNALAHKYLRSDRAFRYIIEPSARAPAQR